MEKLGWGSGKKGTILYNSVFLSSDFLKCKADRFPEWTEYIFAPEILDVLDAEVSYIAP